MNYRNQCDLQKSNTQHPAPKDMEATHENTHIIDGGGIRGLIPALVLAEIETRTGKAVADCFDLIVGTSTGGILALGFARDDGSGKPKYTAKDLAGIYQTREKEIFSRSLWKGAVSLGGLADELYSHKGLDAVLDEYFGNEPLGAALTNTLITSYDIQNRQLVFFKIQPTIRSKCFWAAGMSGCRPACPWHPMTWTTPPAAMWKTSRPKPKR